MKRIAGVITELHDVIRKKIHEISNGDDAEAAGMAKHWFDLVEDTNFEGINFNEDVYEKMVASKSIPADMSYFTFRNHFISKVLEPVREAMLEFLTDKDSSLKRDREELEWISGFLDHYVTVASANRVVADLRKSYVANKLELQAAYKWAEGIFRLEKRTMNKLAKRIDRIAKSLVALFDSDVSRQLEHVEKEFNSTLKNKPLMEGTSDYLYLLMERDKSDPNVLWLGCGEPLGNAGLLSMDYKVEYDLDKTMDGNLEDLVEEVEANIGREDNNED